jgi:hypothetical protein
MARCIEHKIYSILAHQLGGAFNQPAHFRLHADVESIALGSLPDRNIHKPILKTFKVLVGPVQRISDQIVQQRVAQTKGRLRMPRGLLLA